MFDNEKLKLIPEEDRIVITREEFEIWKAKVMIFLSNKELEKKIEKRGVVIEHDFTE